MGAICINFYPEHYFQFGLKGAMQPSAGWLERLGPMVDQTARIVCLLTVHNAESALLKPA